MVGPPRLNLARGAMGLESTDEASSDSGIWTPGSKRALERTSGLGEFLSVVIRHVLPMIRTALHENP